MKKALTLMALAGLLTGCGRNNTGTMEGGDTGTDQGASAPYSTGSDTNQNQSGIVVPSVNTDTNKTNDVKTQPAPNVGPAPQDAATQSPEGAAAPR